MMGPSFQSILYLGFSKAATVFPPEEADVLHLIGRRWGGDSNEDLHQKAEETIHELTALHEMGKAGGFELKLENLFELIGHHGS